MNTLQPIFDRIDKVKNKLGVTNSAAWYRGQTKPYQLLPSLHRHLASIPVTLTKGVDPREEGLFNEFLFRSPELSLRTHSSWEVLSMMQHYRTPTRLLDWTENLFVALYFACLPYLRTDNPASCTPCIYVMNPYKLTKAAIDTSLDGAPLVRRNDGLRMIEITAHPDLDYASTFIAKHSWWFNAPLPISSPWQNRRLDAQRGFFTVHGNNPEAINKQVGVSKHIKRIDILPECLPGIKRLLLDANIDHFTLFRDYESLSDVLRKKFS